MTTRVMLFLAAWLFVAAFAATVVIVGGGG